MTKKTGAWIRLITSSILAVILIGVLLVGCFGDGGFHFNPNFSFGFLSGVHYSDADDYTVGNGSFTADTLTDVEINWVSGEISVLPSDGDKIEIAETSSGTLKDKDKLRYLYRNGKLTIQYKKSAFSFFSFNADKKLEVKIPRKLIDQLSDVTINNVSSDVELTNLTTKTLQIENVSGNVKGTNITVSKNADIETVSGDITMEGALGGIDSETVSSACTYISSVTPQKVDAESVSGDISLQLPGDADFEADYDTVSGSFSCDFSTTSKGDSVICGSGQGNFDFDTVSGDIRIGKKE